MKISKNARKYLENVIFLEGGQKKVDEAKALAKEYYQKYVLPYKQQEA